MANVLEKKWTKAEYLAFERASQERHELIRGNLINMSGASLEHNQLSSNLHILFGIFLFEKPEFRVFQSDMRISDLKNDSYCYPDLVVIEGKPQFEDSEFDTLLNPFLIVEVMSKSTQRYDKFEKFEIYKQLDSLQEYMLVSQEKMSVKLYRKIAKNHWELFDYEQDNDEIAVLNTQFKISLKSIYNKVNFE